MKQGGHRQGDQASPVPGWGCWNNQREARAPGGRVGREAKTTLGRVIHRKSPEVRKGKCKLPCLKEKHQEALIYKCS